MIEMPTVLDADGSWGLRTLKPPDEEITRSDLNLNKYDIRFSLVQNHLSDKCMYVTPSSRKCSGKGFFLHSVTVHRVLVCIILYIP